jgi:hypothetical protein
MKRSFPKLKRVVGLLLLATGCHSAFTTKAPSGFVELHNPGELFVFRATNPDGLVVATRTIDHDPRGELSFWVHAVENAVRSRAGYALIDTRDVRIAGGYPGKQLRFGHDELNHPHLYYVTLVVTRSTIYVLEAGGEKTLLEQQEQPLAAWLQGFRAERCAPFPFWFACTTLGASDASRPTATQP